MNQLHSSVPVYPENEWINKHQFIEVQTPEDSKWISNLISLEPLEGAMSKTFLEWSILIWRCGAKGLKI